MKTIVTRSVVLDRSGYQLAPSLPMATRCEPTQRAIQRAKGLALSQREQRERAEAMRLLASYGFEPQPAAPEMPAKLALHQEQPPEADPQFSAQYLQSLLLGIVLGAASAILFEATRP